MTRTAVPAHRVNRDPYADAPDYGAIRFLHRLNPLAKIAGPLPAMVVLIFSRDLGIPLALVALALALLLVGAHLSGRALLGLFVVLPLATAVLAVSLGLWTDASRVDSTPVLFQIGDFRFYAGSLLVGATAALRLAGILSLSLIAGLTSTGPDLVRALVQHLHVPYRVGYTALAAYRFVPRFGHELDVIRQAHRVRGMAAGRGPVAAVRRGFGTVVPLLAGGIRHAERVALAMDSRAFGASATRTERHLVPFRARDWAFMAAFWLATAAIVIAQGF
ncbi:energy-coupling factor transporter transmembrane protein EcfT [Herbiconiux sp. CPCC 205763]|uniref:Energy-coupling factor transporter transmembrane protein EcfT n=1 Tax=Herbiconiux aconitum TaxID=2970913 RepID=A0ABT2GLD4_9MICO|nr:energy-coupling factor transporter transmembrane component T [Herbiconiux aconitum]MCS5716978.1 energy-coupling factor transporter transmembrane protein EcfT [Herbiconiux aconitum]